MRFSHRRAAVVLTAVALVASLAVLPGSAVAKKKKKSNPVAALSKRVTTLSKKVDTLTTNLNNVQGTVNQGIPIITQLVSGLQQASSGLTSLKSALTTVGNGLTSLSTAVQDTTTGLPGLNNARPLVGAVVGGAASTGSEFTVVAHLANAVGPGTGAYLLSFVNGQGTATDVSKRVFEVTDANPANLTANSPSFSAVDCAATAGATTLCSAINGSADNKNTDVAVITKPDAMDFQIAAISG